MYTSNDGKAMIKNYNVKETIGKGSFGSVVKAISQPDNKIVAIKIIDTSKMQDPFLEQSLQTEIQVMKDMRSQNIVELYEVFKFNHYLYMVLEFCPDGDLEHFIMKKGGMLEEEESIQILKQLMRGFYELFKRGYIHRDIKPANCLINNGIHKVADFGFAVKVDFKGKTILQEQVGTPLYMSPQLLKGQPYGIKSDIWSIGMLFYKMLFGSAPWPTRDVKSLLNAIEQKPLRFPYEKQIQEDTKDFIKKCLVIEENNRMGWEQIFKHPVIAGGMNKSVFVKQQTFSKEAKQILKFLQEVVYRHKVDVKKIFLNFDKDKSGGLDEEEFFKMVQVLDKTASKQLSDSIFEAIDTDKSKIIEYNEFMKIFNEYDFADVNDLVGKMIYDIREIIIANNINLYKLFEKFDKDKSNLLDLKEFGFMMKTFLPGIKDYEIQMIFQRLDDDNNHSISFDEFFLTFDKESDFNNQKTTNNQKQNPSQNQQVQNKNESPLKQENSQASIQKSGKRQSILVAHDIIKQLKDIIIKNNLDILKIFKKFDRSGDGKLDINEFYLLIQVIKPDIKPEENIIAFNLIKKNKGDSIDFMEFYEVFKSNK